MATLGCHQKTLTSLVRTDKTGKNDSNRVNINVRTVENGTSTLVNINVRTVGNRAQGRASGILMEELSRIAQKQDRAIYDGTVKNSLPRARTGSLMTELLRIAQGETGH